MISGPSGGGKSRWAEALAERSGLSVVYLATGPLLPDDDDWQRRLHRHRQRRPGHWQCREVQGNLADGLAELRAGQIALVDSLGTWVAAHLDQEDPAWQQECDRLLAVMLAAPAPLLLVCEETGWGVVPASAAGARFRDRLARLQRELGVHCRACWLVLQGRAIDLVASGQPVPSG
ncbi:MAG: bifunctional adenosylcobinamide kinase/adenosylcobinamide-phosphate guanylyltransferase [Cyanobium sp.]